MQGNPSSPQKWYSEQKLRKSLKNIFDNKNVSYLEYSWTYRFFFAKELRSLIKFWKNCKFYFPLFLLFKWSQIYANFCYHFRCLKRDDLWPLWEPTSQGSPHLNTQLHNGSRLTISYISFSSFTFSSAPYRIFPLFLLWLPYHFYLVVIERQQEQMLV